MEATQLNVRLDKSIKSAGDAVLRRQNVSAARIIRDLWRYMADHQEVPDFERFAQVSRDTRADCAESKKATRAEVEGSAGLAVRLAREAGIRTDFDRLSYEELRELAFEEMLVEQEEKRHA